MKQYPSWRYHATEEARIVKSAEEDDALGPGWADTPAAFYQESPVESAEESNQATNDDPGAPAPAKRGRGRPRKNP